MADILEKPVTEKPEASPQVRPHDESPLAVSGNPFEMVKRFAEEIDRAFEDFGYGFNRKRWTWPMLMGRGREMLRRETGLIPAQWSPRLEVMRKDGNFIVRAELPGLKREDVKVEVNDEALTIQGERKEEKEEKRDGAFYTERSYGTFFRSVPLPEGAESHKATAHFRDGVLEVTVPAVEAPEPPKPEAPRRLEIREG